MASHKFSFSSLLWLSHFVLNRDLISSNSIYTTGSLSAWVCLGEVSGFKPHPWNESIQVKKNRKCIKICPNSMEHQKSKPHIFCCQKPCRSVLWILSLFRLGLGAPSFDAFCTSPWHYRSYRLQGWKLLKRGYCMGSDVKKGVCAFCSSVPSTPTSASVGGVRPTTTAVSVPGLGYAQVAGSHHSIVSGIVISPYHLCKINYR